MAKALDGIADREEIRARTRVDAAKARVVTG